MTAHAGDADARKVALTALARTIHPVLVPVPQVAAQRTSDQVQWQRAASRAALARCAQIVGAPLAGWQQNADRVPLPNAGFHWSVTHKRLWTGAVISNEPTGVDVEQLMERQRRTHDHVASPEEWQLAGPDTWNTFYRVWTGKETTLKSHGRGIGRLRACRIVGVSAAGRMTLSYEDHLSQVEHRAFDGHLAAVLCDDREVVWHVATDVVVPNPMAQGET